MNARWKISAGLAAALAIGVAIGMSIAPPLHSTAQGPDTPVGRYTVVHTEGTNMIVTDNKASTVYYYTIEPGTEAGSDLKLRASLDLTQVGKDVLKPKLFKKNP
jgi:hypothetical protein